MEMKIFFILILCPLIYGEDNAILFEEIDALPSPAQQYPKLIQRRIFNTSYATAVSLFKFCLPRQASNSNDVDLANQAVLGIFAVIVATSFLIFPAFFSSARPHDFDNLPRSSSSEAILKRLINSQAFGENSLLQHRIGLDGTKCIQRAVCEAFRAPTNEKYGLLTLPFQLLIWPNNESKGETFQRAAWTGKETNQECGEKYKCFFDILGLTNYFSNWYQQENSRKFNKFNLNSNKFSSCYDSL